MIINFHCAFLCIEYYYINTVLYKSTNVYIYSPASTHVYLVSEHVFSLSHATHLNL